MSKKQKIAALALVLFGIIFLTTWYLHSRTVAVFQPRGTVGAQEKHLMVTAVLLSLIVVIPVYVMLIGFAWKYREGNKQARYEPGFDHSRLLESIWWGVPMILITVLGVIAWRSSIRLDPFRPLSSQTPSMTVQVVALQWKWLFIYPSQKIAAVNYVQIPVNTPVKFEITSDAPMNSFWIPQLGGQIYAMSGMQTDLNLEASQAGKYEGTSANISGAGFAGMNFTAQAVRKSDFNNWVSTVKQKPSFLTQDSYKRLADPSKNNPVAYYGSAPSSLFDYVVQKYLSPVYFNPAEIK